MPSDIPDKSLLHSITRIVDTIANEGTGSDNLINVLSLLCLISILTRNQAPAAAISAPQTGSSSTSNPLQKILGDLLKSDGGGNGPSPDMLMSLLPLLNNPQIKSKINPTNIANIMGLMSTLGGSSTEKHDNPKQEKQEKKENPPPNKETPAAAVTSSMPISPENSDADDQTDQTELDKKGLGRYLNWKSSF